MIKLTEIRSSAGTYNAQEQTVATNYSLQSIYLNEKYIFLMRENKSLRNKVNSENVLEGLRDDVSFTQLSIAAPGTAPLLINIVGNVEQILENIKKIED
jgi:hypothetical protein